MFNFHTLKNTQKGKLSLLGVAWIVYKYLRGKKKSNYFKVSSGANEVIEILAKAVEWD